MTAREIAENHKVSTRTVYRWRAEGDPRGYAEELPHRPAPESEAEKLQNLIAACGMAQARLRVHLFENPHPELEKIVVGPLLDAVNALGAAAGADGDEEDGE